MPQIQAIRGLRYDLGHVGSLSDVVAPPYDVIGPELQDELYKKHPANTVRLILNREEPGDDDANNRYARAERFLKTWIREGVLTQESDPAIYVYHQEFEAEGNRYVRHGFMAGVKLVRFGEGNIYPHEETHSSAKADRLKLFNATKTNLSQIFGLYPDPGNKTQKLLDDYVMDKTPLVATDHLGVVHRLWPITDLQIISQVSAAIADAPMYVADGHHRYETACNYKDQLAESGELTSVHPANYVMTMLVSMSDQGMIVLPTHRLFRGLPAMSSDDLVAKLGEYFDVTLSGQGADQADTIWTDIATADNQGQIGFYCPVDNTWVMATINEAGEAKMAEVAAEHSGDWQGLGVSILHRLVIETLLGAKDLPKANYVHLVSEVEEGIEHGDPENGGQPYPLAAVVMPATIDHIRSISEHGERMPAKSTYFYPKLLSGLVFNPLT
ncbi:DUF1015 domain-containing protein [Blastopirellula sp. JC732]|uniref:DUF1015 domain-containing protein n=1 Tax=Blastopirellula sediminis TaxID=2894196 RepID=A0A9X1MHR8_9BACT|nr:DUF1015 domain-containing protein [Blastopirellula sediminis]MCC9604271.1 DUF1015 domain-containing protein [Blastopirellula sediminis]MCC9626791.1 DUF1015 domain-containing protein [Blastopirellula sediminis]